MERIILQRVLFIIIGLVFIGLGIFAWFQDSRMQRRCTEKVTATVVDNVEVWKNDDQEGIVKKYNPVIRFETLNGIVEDEYKIEYSSPTTVGTEVTVYYNLNDRHEFYIEGESGGFYRTILCFIAAVVSFIPALFFTNNFMKKLNDKYRPYVKLPGHERIYYDELNKED